MFIIIGLVILGLVLILNIPTDSELTISSDFSTDPIVNFVDECIQESILSGLKANGYSSLDVLENHVNSEVKQCTDDFSNFATFTVIGEDVSSDLVLSDDNLTIKANVNFPLTISSDNKYSKLSSFYVEFKLDRAMKLYTPGVISEISQLTSVDGNANLIIPAGTTVSVPGGAPVTSLSIVMKDVTDVKGDFLGNIMYNLKPNGAQFSKNLILEIKYEDEDLVAIPDGSNPEDYLSIATFDSAFDPVLAKPVLSSVNKGINLVTTNTNHFSSWVVTSTAANQNFQWKHYLDQPGGIYGGRRTAVRWPSAFYTNYGMRSSGTKSIAETTNMAFYQDDIGNGASHRLSYGQGSKTPSSFSGTIDVIFCENGMTFAKGRVSPTQEKNIDVHSLTCLSPDCGGPAATACVGTTGAGGGAGGCTAVGIPSSPANCDSWDYSASQACPAGYVNCDGENNCGFSGVCADCPVECP